MGQSRPYTFSMEGEPSEDAVETAAYIAAMTKELAGMARQSRLEIIAYLLDIVQLEASGVASRPGTISFERRLET